MTAAASAVIEKIDELLKDEANLNTRTGLRLMATVWKEGLQVVGAATQKHDSITTRLANVEGGLNELITKIEAKEKRAEEERFKWRWTIIGSVIAVLISQIAQWVFR